MNSILQRKQKRKRQQNLLKIMKNKAYTVMILINVIQIHLLNYNILEAFKTLIPLQTKK